MDLDRHEDGRSFETEDLRMWRDALAGGLSTSGAVMPPIPRYVEFP